MLRLFGRKPEIVKSQLPVDDEPPFSAELEMLPYRVRDDFLSPAEYCFYLVLKGMMGGYLTICPKVCLGDLFFVARPNENFRAYNRINRKHVDYLLCDPGTMKPVFGIELDDRSHERLERAERDEFVERVFEAAGLPLVRVPVQTSYHTYELGAQFRQAMLREAVHKGNAIEAEAGQTDLETASGPAGST